jgi:hypothetical protein
MSIRLAGLPGTDLPQDRQAPLSLSLSKNTTPVGHQSYSQGKDKSEKAVKKDHIAFVLRHQEKEKERVIKIHREKTPVHLRAFFSVSLPFLCFNRDTQQKNFPP